MRCQTLQQLLVRRAFISAEQLRSAVEASRSTGSTWLEHLLVKGLLDEERLAAWVSRESMVPRCANQCLIQIPPSVIAHVPPEVAIEHRLVPVLIDPDGYLHIAMMNPIDLAGLEEARFFAGVRVMREVASASAIAWALHRYYGAASLLWPLAPPVARACGSRWLM